MFISWHHADGDNHQVYPHAQTNKDLDTWGRNQEDLETKSKSMHFYLKESIREHLCLQQNSDFELNKK